MIFILRRFSEPVEIEMDHPHRGVVGHGPAGAVKNMGEGPGRQRCDLCGELCGRHRCMVAERRVIDHLPRLLG
jgi:hypothetical protein